MAPAPGAPPMSRVGGHCRDTEELQNRRPALSFPFVTGGGEGQGREQGVWQATVTRNRAAL